MKCSGFYLQSQLQGYCFEVISPHQIWYMYVQFQKIYC